jgi:hydroxymethylglutaryl-CoA synthase
MMDSLKRIPIGIDDISVYYPKLFVSTTGEFASSRGLVPAKLIKGIGIERMAIPDRHEDASTMAASSILELMRRNDLQPEQVGKIYIGTESAVDEAKALGTYVIGMLEKVFGQGSFHECSTVEFKSACIGATLALESVLDWLKSTEAEGITENKVGIVVASDIAKYELRSPGEYTQGAGSISLLVKENPRMIALDPYRGVFTRDENDFFRPIGFKTAIVNGKHSNYCYLSAVEGAFESYRRRMLNRGGVELAEGECVTDRMSHILFHIPYPRMIEYAAEALFRHEWRDLPRWVEVEAEIGVEPRPEKFDGSVEYISAMSEHRKKFSKTALFLNAFKSKVEGSSMLSRQVGNIYTGSIYLGLASLLEARKLRPSERLLFGSYGSGCSAAIFSGTVQSDIDSVPLRDLMRRIGERKELSINDYELLHEGLIKESILPPKGEFALIGIDKQGYRLYDFIK